jgi:hypothetical protein
LDFKSSLEKLFWNLPAFDIKKYQKMDSEFRRRHLFQFFFRGLFLCNFCPLKELLLSLDQSFKTFKVWWNAEISVLFKIGTALWAVFKWSSRRWLYKHELALRVPETGWEAKEKSERRAE